MDSTEPTRKECDSEATTVAAASTAAPAMARVPFVGRLHLYLPHPTKSFPYFNYSSSTSSSAATTASAVDTSLTPPPTPPSSCESEQDLEEVEPMEHIAEETEEEEESKVEEEEEVLVVEEVEVPVFEEVEVLVVGEEKVEEEEEVEEEVEVEVEQAQPEQVAAVMEEDASTTSSTLWKRKTSTEESSTANNGPVMTRNSLEYVALVFSFLFLVIESFLRVITLALPAPLINFFYGRSRALFNSFSAKRYTTVESSTQERGLVAKVRDADGFVDLCEIWNDGTYRIEEHVVQTGDGYLLGLHRVVKKTEEEINGPPRARARGGDASTRGNGGKKVVYLHHGLLMDSEVWVCLLDKEQCLPFVLAEKGYDVWLGNNRGNKYSKKSIHHPSSSAKFWDFSIDDFAFHDIPDSINYILETTNQPSLSYVGFSQGTAQAFATLSIHPKLNEKIDVFVALAPAMSPAGLSNTVVDALMKSSPNLMYLFFGRKSILSSTTFWQSVLYPPIFVRVIDISMHFLFKWTGNNIPLNQKLAAYSHLYSYTSVKSVVHWFQIIRNKCFQMYDDDIQTGITASIANRSFYKVAKFPTRNITAPIVLVYGGCDSLVDIRIMLKELPAHTVATEIAHFEHLDFLWGRDVEKLVFPHVLEALETYSNDPESMDVATVTPTESKVTDTLTEEREATPEPRQLTAESLPTYSEDEATAQSHTVADEESETEPEVEAVTLVEAQVEAEPEEDEGVELDSDADAADVVETAHEASIEAEVEADFETEIAVAVEAELKAELEAELATELEAEIETEIETEIAAAIEAKFKAKPEAEDEMEDEVEAQVEEAKAEETLIAEPAYQAATKELTLESRYAPTSQPLPSPPIVTTKEEAPVGDTITPPKFSSAKPLTPPTGPGSRSPPRQSLGRSVFSSPPGYHNSTMRAGSPLAYSTTSSQFSRLSTPPTPTGLSYPPPTGPAAQTGVALSYGDRPITPMTQKVTRSGSMGSNRSFGSSNSLNGGGFLGTSSMSVGSGRPAAPLNEEGIPTGPRGYVAPKPAFYPSTPPPTGPSSCFSPPTGPRADRSPPTGPRSQRRYTNSPGASPRSPQQNYSYQQQATNGGYSPGSPRGANKNRRRGRGRGRSSSDLGPTTVGAGRNTTPAMYRGHGEMRMSMHGGEGSLYSDYLGGAPTGY
ncbi:Alpha/Beta hydrolase protein [Tricharina praecox]|uniref:Alpha/Beta hydrolase protein n=1 Tax=Tricharina praecox TaxID=43433 RepID=UPI00222050D2|nr:Alpha/Beta hydrolase protein [Tricharina praecox]KAI5856439.1 Alpha/Beta hydrolase protein [Tricharina praecox]